MTVNGLKPAFYLPKEIAENSSQIRQSGEKKENGDRMTLDAWLKKL